MKQRFGIIVNCIGMYRTCCCVLFPDTGESQDPDLPLAIALSGGIECCVNYSANTTMPSHHLVLMCPRRFLIFTDNI